MGRRDPLCRTHRHPKLRRGVTREQVREELEDLYHRAGFPGPVDLDWTGGLHRTHNRNTRRYAQVAPHAPGRPHFELAPQTVMLPPANRRGLLAHEVGHVLDPEGGEDDADRAAREALGIKIGYDRRWPGKGLQVARRNPPYQVYMNPPPWAERAMKKAWPELLKLVGPERLPSGPGAEEFGCGHYGCVWPTASGQVVKITSDATEASFVAAYLRLGGIHGMVGYHQILKLRSTHRRRPVFVIWRDEAWEVGGLNSPPYGESRQRDDYERRAYADARMFLDSFKAQAHKAREYLKARQRRKGDAAELANAAWKIHGQQPHWSRGSWGTELRTSVHSWDQKIRYNEQAFSGLRGVDALAARLAACAHLAMEMQTSVRFMSQVGQALGDSLEDGILLADVHAQNVGKIKIDGDYLDWGITDPGHAVFLASRWDDLTVPDLVAANPRRRRRRRR